MPDKPPHKVFSDFGDVISSMNRSAFPLAARGTLSALAYETRQRIVNKAIPKAFTVRNTFEKRTVLYWRGPNTFDINKMHSTTGQVDKTRFKRAGSNKELDDLRQQELGLFINARPGRKLVRTPTIQARIGKSRGRAVSRANRPTAGAKWDGLSEIEQGLRKGVRISAKNRVRRAHALRIKANKKSKDSTPYILPKANNLSQKNVYRVIRGKPVVIHTLRKSAKRLKKKKTVEPSFHAILNTRGDKIWEEQIQRRMVKDISKRMRKLNS